MSNRRLAIIADVHLGLAGREIAPLLQLAVEKTLELNPRKVVLLGDIVNRGYPQEYEQAGQILRPLSDRLEPVVGNHELQRAGVADFEAAWGTKASRKIELCGLPALLLNSAIENLPDTQWNGRLDACQLDMLTDFLAEHREQPAMVVCHYPPAGTVRRSEQPMFGLDNSAEVMQLLHERTRPLLFVSGHTHRASVTRLGPCVFIGCPALGFWPHAFMVIDLTHRRAAYRTIQLIDDPSDSPDPDALDANYRAESEGFDFDRSGMIDLV